MIHEYCILANRGVHSSSNTIGSGVCSAATNNIGLNPWAHLTRQYLSFLCNEYDTWVLEVGFARFCLLHLIYHVSVESLTLVQPRKLKGAWSEGIAAYSSTSFITLKRGSNTNIITTNSCEGWAILEPGQGACIWSPHIKLNLCHILQVDIKYDMWD